MWWSIWNRHASEPAPPGPAAPAWAASWHKDGLLNLPEYYHNAVFYSAIFRFIAPVRQGRFEALQRRTLS